MIEVYFSLVILFLVGSMLFTSSEASIFSLSRIDLASLKTFHISEKYWKILKTPEELLIVLIAGNEIVDYFASLCFSNALGYILVEKSKEISFIIFSIIAFWCGDFFPKLIGFKFRNRLIPKILPYIYFFYTLFYPLRKIFSLIYKKTEKYIQFPQTNSSFFSPVEQIILQSLEIAYKENKISEKEKEFIYGLFLSEKIPVSAIMTTRSEIVAFRDQVLTVEFLEKLKKLPYNKFPIYKENLDDILGILYIKDLIKNFSPEKLDKTKLSEFVKPAFFVPENFKVRELLFEFQKKQIKIALVIDEYGILKGLVTLEDVLEELFGEIYEEKEIKIKPIQKIGKNKWLIHGKTLMDELSHILDLEIEEDDLKEMKTLNGFLLALFKELPKENQKIKYKNYQFTIKKIKGRKIFWVEIERI